jgi:hypothetical protein
VRLDAGARRARHGIGSQPSRIQKEGIFRGLRQARNNLRRKFPPQTQGRGKVAKGCDRSARTQRRAPSRRD